MDLGKAHIVIMWTVGPEEVAAGDACFQSHGKWMEGHSRQGDTALLDYSISKGPELANPVDPDSAPTGDTVFVLDEFYASPAAWPNTGGWPGYLAGSAGLHGLDQQGQEGRYAAQRNGGSGPLVTAAPRFFRRRRAPWSRRSRSRSVTSLGMTVVRGPTDDTLAGGT